MRKYLIVAIAFVALCYGCGCAGVVLHGNDLYGGAVGQAKFTVTETPAVQVCKTVRGPATEAGGEYRPRLEKPVYQPILADSRYATPVKLEAQVQCQTVSAGRKIVVEGGPISNVLAWIAVTLFSGGVTDALSGLIP